MNKQQILSQQWASKRMALSQALSRLSLLTLYEILSHLSQVDLIIKGVISGDAWNQLMQVSLTLAGTSLNLKNVEMSDEHF